MIERPPRTAGKRTFAEDRASAAAIVEAGPLLVRAVVIDGERVEALRWRIAELSAVSGETSRDALKNAIRF